MTRRSERFRTVAPLTACGGLAFWTSNLLISLTPIAADYRANQLIGYGPMLAAALVGGLGIALFVAYCLVHFHDSIPTHSALSKSLVLSALALLVVTLVLEVPAKFSTDINNPLHYLVVATAFNALRILALGVTVGLLEPRFVERALQR